MIFFEKFLKFDKKKKKIENLDIFVEIFLEFT